MLVLFDIPEAKRSDRRVVYNLNVMNGLLQSVEELSPGLLAGARLVATDDWSLLTVSFGLLRIGAYRGSVAFSLAGEPRFSINDYVNDGPPEYIVRQINEHLGRSRSAGYHKMLDDLCGYRERVRTMNDEFVEEFAE